MKPKSVKKKLKQPSFAAGVNRDQVRRGRRGARRRLRRARRLRDRGDGRARRRARPGSWPPNACVRRACGAVGGRRSLMTFYVLWTSNDGFMGGGYCQRPPAFAHSSRWSTEQKPSARGARRGGGRAARGPRRARAPQCEQLTGPSSIAAGSVSSPGLPVRALDRPRDHVLEPAEDGAALAGRLVERESRRRASTPRRTRCSSRRHRKYTLAGHGADQDSRARGRPDRPGAARAGAAGARPRRARARARAASASTSRWRTGARPKRASATRPRRRCARPGSG